MMKSSKKLVLGKQTITKIADDALQGAAGGATQVFRCSAAQSCYFTGCCPQ